MADITLKAGDLEPPITATITGSDGAGVNLSTATSVAFRIMNAMTGIEVFSRACTVDNAATGLVHYDWVSGDTDVYGLYLGEFVVTWPTARPQTYPSKSYLLISIEPKA